MIVVDRIFSLILHFFIGLGHNCTSPSFLTYFKLSVDRQRYLIFWAEDYTRCSPHEQSKTFH